jgi:hypothetical protein
LVEKEEIARFPQVSLARWMSAEIGPPEQVFRAQRRSSPAQNAARKESPAPLGHPLPFASLAATLDRRRPERRNA